MGFISTFVAAALFSTSSVMAKSPTTNSSQVPKKMGITQDRLNALAKYTKVIQTIEQYYVDDENITDIVDKSLEGLMSNLDAHSSFMNEKKYKDMKIQPSEFINKNKLLFAEGNAIKYICRHAAKGEVQDLEKAKHYIDMIIERDYS